MRLYRINELTNHEIGRIKRSKTIPTEVLAKRFNTYESVIEKILGSRKCNKIRQVFRNGSFVVWNGIGEIPHFHKGIKDCLEGRREQFKGSRWEWLSKPNVKIKKPKRVKMIKSKGRVLLQLDMDGNLIREWRTVSEASRELGIPQGNLSNIANEVYGYKSAKGYKFKFKDGSIKSRKVSI